MDRKRSLFRKERECERGERKRKRERERKCKNNDKVNFFRLMCRTYHDGKNMLNSFLKRSPFKVLTPVIYSIGFVNM